MDSNETEGLMDIEEASAYLSLAVGTLYNKVGRKEIPHKRMGRTIRFSKRDLDAWLVDHPVESPTSDAAEGVA